MRSPARPWVPSSNHKGHVRCFKRSSSIDVPYSGAMSTSAGLARIVVRGLFGQRDVDIQMAVGEPTILTGANGTGKSTLLKLVNAVSEGNLQVLASLPLESFELYFENLPTFRLIRGSKSRGPTVTWGNEKVDLRHLDTKLFSDFPVWVNELVMSAADADLAELLSDEARARGLTSDEYRRLRERLFLWRGRSHSEETHNRKPDWINKLPEAFPVLFVTDQRLIVEHERSGRTNTPTRQRSQSRRLAVEAASADIASQMEAADLAYAGVSQAQDRTFPVEVIRAMTSPSQSRQSPKRLRDLLEDVDKRRQALRRVGLLATHEDIDLEGSLTPDILNHPGVVPVMETFLKSTVRKLEVYTDLAARLTPFKNFLDERFDPKLMTPSRSGLAFNLPHEKDSIRVGQLSSGEQQLFVLAYEILFRTKPGTLVIIDEPEISLHVMWQDTLVRDLISMGEPAKLQFLMATHSPVIAAGNRNAERSLDLFDE
jgi:energy-coupling factor transporter ATP-binding protein EcfA2